MRQQRMLTRAVAVSAATVLLLAGCGSEDEGMDPVDTTQAPPADDETDDGADSATEDEDTSSEATDDEDGQSDAAGEHAGLLAGIDLAEEEAEGTAFEVDDEDGGNWEISVASGDEEIEVLVSGDGTEVLGTDHEGSLESEDRAGLDAATITISEAIETAAAEVTGQIDDVELDDEDGTFAWEVNFLDDVEVYVDAATGEILRIEND